jgi:hypothetical protein
MSNPRGRKLSALFIVCCLCGMSFSTALAVDVPNKKEIITKARQSYYNLHTEGLAGYTCVITPDWSLVLADQWKSDPTAADKTTKILKQIQFNMVLAADNSVQISHSVPLTVSAQDAAPLKQIYDGMNQMTTGFFQTATPFILDAPFPAADGDYQLDDQGTQYLLTYKEGGAAITTQMDKNLVLSSLSVTTEAFTSTLQPTFVKNPKGLLLSGYMAIYKSKNPAEDTQLNVKISYQEVEGLQVPEKLSLSGSYGGTPFSLEVAFSNYKITRK